MAHYIIRDDSVAAVAYLPAKTPKDALIVGSAADITKCDLPAAKLTAVRNALPGVTRMAKFKDRETAAKRLWAAFEKPPVSAANKSARITERNGKCADWLAGAGGIEPPNGGIKIRQSMSRLIP